MGKLYKKAPVFRRVSVKQLTERINIDTLRFLTIYHAAGRSPLALLPGELSPQVTERALPPFLNSKVNLCTYPTKIPVDLPVRKP